MFAIRRDLRRGKTNGFFQIREAVSPKKMSSVVDYIDGTKYDIIMHECELYINENISEKIHSGRYPKKRPCAWIVCNRYEVVKRTEKTGSDITYNPRVDPNYRYEGENVNGKKYNTLTQSNNKIYIK